MDYDTYTNDTTWIKRAFLVPLGHRPSSQYRKLNRDRYGTTAAAKYTNASLGGNFTVNTPPQFTRWADIRYPGIGVSDDDMEGRANGQGSYYSEAIDDTRQEVTMAFGHERFNTMAGFFGGFYDAKTAQLANTGRVDQAFYNMGNATGYLLSLPLQPFIVAGKVAGRFTSWLSRMPASKWSYFKPAMHSYWSAVNNIANIMAINIGIAPRLFDDEKEKLRDSNTMSANETADYLHHFLPELFRPDGGIDVMNLANRCQRIGDRMRREEVNRRNQSSGGEDFMNSMLEYYQKVPVDPNPNASSNDLFEQFGKTADGQSKAAPKDENDDGEDSIFKDIRNATDFVTANLRDGNQFVTFRVNHKSTFSESFSNSTEENNIVPMFNGKVSSARSASHTFMAGNVNQTIERIKGSVQSFVSGALDSVNLGGLASLAGSGFLDVPKQWSGSTADLPRADYTVPLYGHYGNPISRFMNLYVPISMFLAAALPLSTGRSSYTSPFVCQLYHTGRVQCKYGIIDRLSITRGGGNIGWNANDEMLNAEISFSVVDFSSIMSVPIKGGYFQDNGLIGGAVEAAVDATSTAVFGNTSAADFVTGRAFDDESVFQDYLAVLGGLPVSDSFYMGKRLNLKTSYSNARFRNWTSPSNFYSWLTDTGPARFFSGFTQTADATDDRRL